MTAALDFSTPHLIRNDDEYDEVVAELNRLLDEHPVEGSSADERIEFLSLLVEDYDRKHFELPGGDVTPQQVVEYLLEARGMRRGDLAAIIGGKNRVSEFISAGRPLSMRQVLKLREELAIPADLLVSAQDAAPRRRGSVTRAKSYGYQTRRGAKNARKVSERIADGAKAKHAKRKSKPKASRRRS